jgi:hypothetical protein
MLKIKSLILAIACMGVGAAHALDVSQGYSTPYYAEYVAGAHLKEAFRFMDNELRKYDCIQGETSAEIIKKVKTKIFSDDIPGELFLSYKTKCFSPDVAAVRFYVSDIGYDEDYTQVALEVTTKNAGKIYKEICVYGLDGDVRKCPQDYKRATDFSKEI